MPSGVRSSDRVRQRDRCVIDCFTRAVCTHPLRIAVRARLR